MTNHTDSNVVQGAFWLGMLTAWFIAMFIVPLITSIIMAVLDCWKNRKKKGGDA
jgi:hypothetical protein